MTYTQPQPMQTPHQAAVMHPTAQQPVSTTQQVPQGAVFQGKFALFNNTKPGAKSQFSGRVTFSQYEVAQVIHYLQTTMPNERGNIEMWMTGFNNTSKTGISYIGGYVAPQQAQQGVAVQYANQQQLGQVASYAQQGTQQVQQQVYAQPPVQQVPVQGNPPF